MFFQEVVVGKGCRSKHKISPPKLWSIGFVCNRQWFLRTGLGMTEDGTKIRGGGGGGGGQRTTQQERWNVHGRERERE